MYCLCVNVYCTVLPPGVNPIAVNKYINIKININIKTNIKINIKVKINIKINIKVKINIKMVVPYMQSLSFRAARSDTTDSGEKGRIHSVNLI